MTSLPRPMPSRPVPDRPALPAAQLAVQAPGPMLFVGFAVAATALAFVFVPPAGVLLAVFFGWLGVSRFLRPLSPRPDRADRGEALPASTGNRRFDSYRAGMLDQLEEERQSFAGFLDRLREAKDRTEFDSFMGNRARTTAAGS